MQPPLYVIGDIHGQYDKLITLLFNANLITDDLSWNGEDAQLWFMGDFFDRGPNGIGVVELVMRLQTQAAAAGGEVHALLGNHEIMFLAAHYFNEAGGFAAAWKRNGGRDSDRERVNPRQIDWLRSLPAMALVDNYLLVHADALFYREYGDTVAQVNQRIAAILHSGDIPSWARLLDHFAERMSFIPARRNGVNRAVNFLRHFGGLQIVHGHTPIQYLTDTIDPLDALAYSVDLCLNVDGGMYLGGTGFVHRLLP